jgi:hypothetical protein
MIPPCQIEQAHFFDVNDVNNALNKAVMPSPKYTLSNPLYVDPSLYNNVRGFID